MVPMVQGVGAGGRRQEHEEIHLTQQQQQRQQKEQQRQHEEQQRQHEEQQPTTNHTGDRSKFKTRRQAERVIDHFFRSTAPHRTYHYLA